MTSAHLPIIDAESAPYWNGLSRGEFLLKYCLDGGRPHYYPRVYCPNWWGETEWRTASGRGDVFATTVVRQMGFPPFRDRVPYNLSIVELEEGPHLLTHVIGVPPETVRIGMSVEL